MSSNSDVWIDKISRIHSKKIMFSVIKEIIIRETISVIIMIHFSSFILKYEVKKRNSHVEYYFLERAFLALVLRRLMPLHPTHSERVLLKLLSHVYLIN